MERRNPGQDTASKDSLPSTRSHLLTFPSLPNSATNWDQGFSTWAFGGHSRSKHNRI
jgi:hypothetical protein